MKVENCYISCAANAIPTVAHWGKNNLICYGSCNAVLIYDLTIGGGKIVKTLVVHTKKVASVRWITGPGIETETELVSGSIDGNVIVWSKFNDEYRENILAGHESNVSIVDGLYKKPNKENTVIISASMDCSVKVWTRTLQKDDFVCAQTITFKYGISMGIKLGTLPYSDLIVLACGMENNQIDLYVEECSKEAENPLALEYKASLTGHENWVRGLDILEVNGELLLCSASQDAFIRLWRISKKNTANEKGDAIMTSTDAITITTSSIDYIIVLESILTGHENWVYSASWSPNKDHIKLISASLDKTMIIWELDQQTGLWLESVRVGEVGGNTLGFYGGMFGPTDNSIMAFSYHGAFHIWNYNKDTNLWDTSVTLGGHFGEVVDLAWEPKGEFLVSVSTDQTTRIHAPWQKNEDSAVTWHEIARPQVHGYDFTSLALLSRYRFVSSAEEKIVRVFTAPENFISNFKRICRIGDDDDIKYVPSKGASVPSLGLSNKAVYEDNNLEQAKPKSEKEIYPEESYFTAVDLNEPPTEETLIQNTLWPEIQKLYGHGYEVFCLAANYDGTLIASACKSTSAEHASIILWDTTTWKQVTKLFSHTLTVVQLSFSPDGNSLLSVSRDRRWSVFKKNAPSGVWFLEATTDKKTGVHTRIIWTGAWSHDSKYFGTGSRDGKAVVWSRNLKIVADGRNCIGLYDPSTIELKGQSVTALAFAPNLVSDAYLIAIGLEVGTIHLYKWENNIWTSLVTLENKIAHHLDVRKLAFRPVFGRAGEEKEENILQLASCSTDHSVRIYDIDLSTIR